MRAKLSTLLTSLLPVLLASSAVAQPPGVRWQNDLESAIHLAGQTNRLVLVHFWAPWCKPCKQLDREVFNQAGLARSLEIRYVSVKINTDQFPAIARRYGVANVPTDVVLSADGQLLSRTNSPSNWQAYANQMAQIASRQSSVAQQGRPAAREGRMVTEGTAAANRGGAAQQPVSWPNSHPAATGNPYHTAGLPAGEAGARAPNRQVPPPVNHPYGHMGQSMASPEAAAMAGGPYYGAATGVREASKTTASHPAYSTSSSTARPQGDYRSNPGYGPVGGRYGSPAVGQRTTAGSSAAYPPNLPTGTAPSSPPDGRRPASSIPPRWATPP
ncbi:MAG: thioredoxin domain-containing protein, partial [Pirellulales bacterium]